MSVRVIAHDGGPPPFRPQAIAVEDDTCHVLSADAGTLRDPQLHPIRLMTALFDTPPTPPGSVVLHGSGPWLMQAVVHDLDRDPSVDEAWVAQALEEVLRLCEQESIADLALEPLGTRHGRFPRERFRELLEALLAGRDGEHPARIWLSA